MKSRVLFFDDQHLGLEPLSSAAGALKSPRVAVTLLDRLWVPSNSAVRVAARLSSGVHDDYVVEPTPGMKMGVPRVVRKGGTEPVVCLVNVADRGRCLRRGTVIGYAEPISELRVEEPVRGNGLVTKAGTCCAADVGDEGPPTVPPHIQGVVNQACELLAEGEQEQLTSLLCNYADVFAASEFDLGNFTAIEHTIDTGDARPVRQRMRRTPMGFAKEEEAHLKEMVDHGVVQESVSDWCSAPVLVRKRDGKVRWCIDYRAVNERTMKDVFPLPLVDDCLDTLSGSVWFSKLDANSAYWQVSIREADRKKTAFVTRYGLFEHVRMGFGLCNAPATYARVMGLVLSGLTWEKVLAFLDDILVLGDGRNICILPA